MVIEKMIFRGFHVYVTIAFITYKSTGVARFSAARTVCAVRKSEPTIT